MSAEPENRRKGYLELHDVDRTIRPASDSTLRGIVGHCLFTEDRVPAPGPLLDRLHAIAEQEAAAHRPLGRRRPFPTILENLALFLEKRGDAAGAARARAELAALRGE